MRCALNVHIQGGSGEEINVLGCDSTDHRKEETDFIRTL